jgi:hypothetical protein
MMKVSKLFLIILLFLPLTVQAQRARNIFEQDTLPTSGCTALGQVIVDRATNKLYRCTVIGYPGKLTPVAEIPDIQSAKYNTCSDAGSTDSYACSLSPAIISYTTGQVVWFKAATANTGAATLALNGLTAKTIKKNKDVDLADNDIKAGQWVAAQYDGTNFQMLSPVSNAGATTLAGLTDVTTTAAELNALHGVKRYVALLSQSGTSAPVAIVQLNTLGFVPVWQRLDVALGENPGDEPGQYGFAIPGLTANKLHVTTSYDAQNLLGAKGAFSSDFGGAGVMLSTTNGGNGSDDALNNVPIMIEVYP